MYQVEEGEKLQSSFKHHIDSIYSYCPDSLKVLGSAFGESISHRIVRMAMVMHEAADWCDAGEQVLRVR